MLSLIQRQPQVKPRSASWGQTVRVFKFVLKEMDPEARQCAIRLLLHTRQRAPFMMGKVIELLAHQYLEAAELPSMRELIDIQIRLERREEFQLVRESTVFFCPEAFKKPYRDIFPQLYDRVHQGLIDKSRTQDSLVEVIYDFLTRWGPTFEQFEEHHRVFLFEICDRTIAKENGYLAAAASTPPERRVLPDRRAGFSEGQTLVWLRRLADEVLRLAEQDLRGFKLESLGSSAKSLLSGALST
ncbi:MAG: hypothetical protein ICV68_16165 [Pyrinomonadaceae bacterium]|nr:hypothetical protein [Pyrinomonadaceae bacterium]